MNSRLAHLLPQAEPPATDARPSGTASDDAATSARLATLEDEVAILAARLDNLMAIIDHKLDSHQDRLVPRCRQPRRTAALTARESKGMRLIPLDRCGFLVVVRAGGAVGWSRTSSATFVAVIAVVFARNAQDSKGRTTLGGRTLARNCTS